MQILQVQFPQWKLVFQSRFFERKLKHLEILSSRLGHKIKRNWLRCRCECTVQQSLNIPGQGVFRHVVVWIGSPWHECPPWAGLGLVHVLDLVLLPPPHVTEQCENVDQWLHPPLTYDKIREEKMNAGYHKIHLVFDPIVRIN